MTCPGGVTLTERTGGPFVVAMVKAKRLLRDPTSKILTNVIVVIPE